MKAHAVCLVLLWFLAGCSKQSDIAGTTEISTWQYGKRGAISITFDDGSINQFRKAIPILNDLGFKGTFFIITGDIPGSTFQRKFTGRPLKEIVHESTIMPTNNANFFERASAIGFLNIDSALSYHTEVGSLFEAGRTADAHALVDKGFARARENKFSLLRAAPPTLRNGITWEEILSFARQGHEFGNHTVTHPRLAVMDEENLLYELEMGKEEILRHLGSYHTFSAECPYGTEDERVMEYAMKVHPALRNRMPEPFLEELNRWNEKSPSASTKPYVQWQRGPLAGTPMELMKSWIDTTVQDDNIWLVLVFHGIDGVGWEAKASEELEEYFNYIKQYEERLWVETFGNVTRYMRERMNTTIRKIVDDQVITMELTHNLDPDMYSLPLTLKTYVDKDWKRVTFRQGSEIRRLTPLVDAKGMYVTYRVVPNSGPFQIAEAGTGRKGIKD